ncbi:contactin-6-like [Halichondria panicea]|uniref:contactin-6-like n=1 Tax=Halichondria panicea TaxID=6063 RepID=UPI00312BB897
MLPCSREALLQRLLQMSMLLCLLQVQLCSSQRTDIQVSRLDGSRSIINILQQREYYMFEGDGITFKCICSNQGANVNTRAVSVRWIHKGEIIESSEQCITLIHTISEATSSNDGEHECEVSYANGTVTRLSAGTLEVVDPNIVVAPPFQYGLIDTSSSLNCTTTSSETSSVSITWFHDRENGASANNQIDRVQISHEGMYVCSVFLATFDLRAIRMINFSVIVPPVILNDLIDYDLLGNQAAQFTVNFQSRFQSETVIVWYKNQNSAVRKELIRTEYTDEPNAVTELYFSNLRRSDAGLYTVVIQNTFSQLSPELRRVQTSFRLDVTVYPVAPSNIHFIDISSTQAKVQWELTNENEDDRPDNITARLYYTNGTIVSQHIVNGTSTELVLYLIPGTEYKLLMTSANIDGEVNSIERNFMSIDGPPSSPHLTVERIGSAVFNITISLAYTGGGNITQFILEVRSKENPTAGWRSLGAFEAVPTGNILEWRVIAMHDQYLSEQGLEFRIATMNTRGHVSEPSLHLEPYDLPGPPTQPNHISSTHDSLLIQVQLSSLGSGPIIAVHVLFEDFNRTLEIRPYSLGELVQVRIEGLQSNTIYRFVVIAENYGGLGEPSPVLEAATEKLPPVPLYGVVLISIGTAIAIILGVAILAIVVRHIYSVQKEKRQYRVGSGSRSEACKTSTGSDKLVSSTKRPPLPKTPTQASTQSSVTSENPRPSSQSAYSRQGSTSTYPLSPQRTISTSDGGSPIEEFEFNHRPDSVAMSNESESDVNYPRYLYRVSPSPPSVSMPHQLIAPAPVISLHSMQSYPSTITNLTASSDSTRDSIILSPTEFRATNV